MKFPSDTSSSQALHSSLLRGGAAGVRDYSEQQDPQKAKNATPYWLITVPEDSRKIAEGIVAQIHEASVQSKISHKVMAQHLLGKSSELEGLAHPEQLIELRAFFQHHLSRDPSAEERLSLIRVLSSENSEDAIQAIRLLIAEESFFKARNALSVPFINAVKDEQRRQTLLLAALADVATSCPKEHFLTMAAGANRVLRGRVLIGPNIWLGDGSVPDSRSPLNPVIGLTTSTDRTIEGFSFRYGFFETRSHLTAPARDTDGGYKVIYPLVSIDEQIYEVLIKMIDGNKGGGSLQNEASSAATANLATSILKGIRDFSTLGGHDTWHHLYYGINSPESSRLAFMGSSSFFSTNNINLPSSFDLAEYDFGQFNSLENHAFLSHRAIWRMITTSREHVTDGLLRRYGNFVDDLSQLEPALASHVGEKQALKMVRFLAILAYDQLALVMPHSEILANTTTNRQGETLDHALTRLGFRDYEIERDKLRIIATAAFQAPEVVEAALRISLEIGHFREFYATAHGFFPQWFEVTVPNPLEHEDLAPLLSILFALDVSQEQAAKDAIKSLIREAQKMLRHDEQNRSTEALTTIFDEVVKKILHVQSYECPDLTLSNKSIRLFLQLANISLDNPYRTSSLFTNRKAFPLDRFLRNLDSTPILPEMMRAAKQVLPKLDNRTLFHFVCRMVSDLLATSQDHKLSGLHALVAEQHLLNIHRPPWIDFFEDEFEPISELDIFHQEMKKSGVLGTPEWNVLKKQFLEVTR